MTLPAGRSVSICTKSTGHLEEAVLQVLVTLDVFWAERVNLQEKYDDPNMGSDQNSWELQAMWSRNPRVIVNAQEKCSLSVMNQDVGCTRGTLILGIKRYWIQLGTMTLSEAIAHFNSRPASAPPTPPYSGRGSRASLWSHIPADIKCGDRPPHFIGRSPAANRPRVVSQLPIVTAPPQAAMEVRCKSIATGAEDGASVVLYDSGATCDEARQGLLAQYRSGKDLCRNGIASTGQPSVYRGDRTFRADWCAFAWNPASMRVSSRWLRFHRPDAFSLRPFASSARRPCRLA